MVMPLMIEMQWFVDIRKVGDAVKGSAAAKSASPLQAATAPPIPGSTTVTAKGTTTDEVESTEQVDLLLWLVDNLLIKK